MTGPMQTKFFQNASVLVTGGTGFVGRHIVNELLPAGASIRIPVNRRKVEFDHQGIETVQADLMVRADCLRVAKGIDYIFHAAGSVGAAGVSANAAMDSITGNLVMTSQMLQSAWTAGVQRFLLFSSSSVYPAADHAVKEEEGWDGEPHESYFGYGWMRRYLEKLALYVSPQSGMQIAVVRPTAVYGRHDNFDPATCHVIPALVRKAVERMHPYEVWGDGSEVRDFLHVSDLARGCLLMLEKYASCDPVNIGYGKGASVKDILPIILRAAGYSDATVVFNASRPTMIPFRMVNTLKAKRLLGFEPEVSLEEGLSDTVRWFSSDRGVRSI